MKKANLIAGYSNTTLLCAASIGFSCMSPLVLGEAKTYSIEEIVVTARKRDETILSTPVTVSALNSADIERYQADNLSEIGDMIPTVIVGTYKVNGGGSLAIRGISSPATQTGFEQPVSVATDGVQSSDGRIALMGYFDLQQVEVLKGPQALFFGKNSPAGVISLVTANPTSELEITTKIGYEFEADEQFVQATISGPITENLGARLALRYKDQKGWLYNNAQPTTNPFYNPATGAPIEASILPGASIKTPGEDELIGRLTLVYETDNDFKVQFKHTRNHANDDGVGASMQNIGPCSDGHPRMWGVVDPGAECKINKTVTVGDIPKEIASTFRLIDTDGTPEGELKAHTTSLQLDKAWGDLNLTSLTGFTNLKYGFFSGLDQTNFSQLALWEFHENDSWSQEFRLTSNYDSALNFMVGVYYQSTEIYGETEIKLRDTFYNPSVDRYIAYEGYADQDGDSKSVFGQLIWDVSDTIEVAAGARWTKEEKEMSHYNAYGFGPFNTANHVFEGSNTIGVLKGKFDDTNVSPELTITWRPNDERTLFVAYKTGFKSGGFGLTNPLQVSTELSDVDFDSEEAKGFEIGFKGLFLDRRLRISSSIFRYDFNDLQVTAYNAERISFTINNAGSVEQYGADLEANFQLSDNLSLHGALAYVHNRFEDFSGQCYGYTFPAGATRATATPPPNCSFVDDTNLTIEQVFDGRAPARSPEWSGNMGAIFSIPMDFGVIDITADAIYSDEYFAAETMEASTLQDDFWRFNASVSLTDPEDHWTISLIGKNLSDELSINYAADRTGGASVPGAIGEQRGWVSRGQEFILQAEYRW